MATPKKPKEVKEDLKGKWQEKLNLHEHLLNNVWLKEKVDHFTREKDSFIALFNFFGVPSMGKLLEVGCGSGAISQFLPKGVEYTGIDPLSGKVSTYNCVYGTAEKIPFPAGSFDMVLINDALAHTSSPLKAIQEMHRVLKPKGLLFLSDEVGKDREDHVVILKDGEIQGLLLKCGFKIKKETYNTRVPLMLDLVAQK